MDCLLDGSLDCTGAIVVISYLSTNAPLVCDLSAIKSAVIFSFFLFVFEDRYLGDGAADRRDGLPGCLQLWKTWKTWKSQGIC